MSMHYSVAVLTQTRPGMYGSSQGGVEVAATVNTKCGGGPGISRTYNDRTELYFRGAAEGWG
jgi:hypothetical protein